MAVDVIVLLTQIAVARKGTLRYAHHIAREVQILEK